MKSWPLVNCVHGCGRWHLFKGKCQCDILLYCRYANFRNTNYKLTDVFFIFLISCVIVTEQYELSCTRHWLKWTPETLNSICMHYGWWYFLVSLLWSSFTIICKIVRVAGPRTFLSHVPRAIELHDLWRRNNYAC